MNARDEAPVKVAFGVVADLCIALKQEPANKYPGCWECAIDEKWWVAMNGHKQQTACSHGVPVDPFTIYVEYNGWPAGAFTPFGGWIAAGNGANEDTFIAACEAATAKAKA